MMHIPPVEITNPVNPKTIIDRILWKSKEKGGIVKTE